jgi:hypothetical protein
MMNGLRFLAIERMWNAAHHGPEDASAMGTSPDWLFIMPGAIGRVLYNNQFVSVLPSTGDFGGNPKQ